MNRIERKTQRPAELFGGCESTQHGPSPEPPCEQILAIRYRSRGGFAMGGDKLTPSGAGFSRPLDEAALGTSLSTARQELCPVGSHTTIMTQACAFASRAAPVPARPLRTQSGAAIPSPFGTQRVSQMTDTAGEWRFTAEIRRIQQIPIASNSGGGSTVDVIV
jgi:hypothetical protein